MFGLGWIKLLKNINIEKNFLHVKGDNKKLEEYYKKASLFVSLSLMEGFGLTPLEAMSFNCPVICSDIPVFREILGFVKLYQVSRNHHYKMGNRIGGFNSIQ